jgi:hypothetical protein
MIMMVRSAAILAVLALLVGGGAARAEDFMTGNYWLGRCSDESELAKAQCVAFLMGVDQYNEMLNLFEHTQKNQLRYCPPAGVTVGQMRAIAVKHLRDNPASLHLPFVMLATEAFIQAFPCPNGK